MDVATTELGRNVLIGAEAESRRYLQSKLGGIVASSGVLM